jgi:hypothetical protein
VGDVQSDPYVLVVSSMAGGTGASMVIDVCRILAGIVPDPMNIVVVVHTPEVFEGLAENQRSGVDANAAAMIGELMALQAGAGIREDQALLRDLGSALPEEVDLPFRRVIPVGARIGTSKERLGSTPDERYRGLGHALGALMIDGTAWERFKKNTLENFGGGVSVDRCGGLGVDADQLVWGRWATPLCRWAGRSTGSTQPRGWRVMPWTVWRRAISARTTIAPPPSS